MEYYWHFVGVGDDNIPRLGYNDNREVKVGETLTIDGAPVLCRHGLHASRKLWDALGYASGSKLAMTRVTLGGTIIHDNTKSAATERTAIAMLDADATEKLLRDWGRWCALQVIHLWDAPEVVRQYLETGDESLQEAASSEAWDTARDTARDAASAAAWAAAWAAVSSEAWDTARDTARAAAWAAARAAAWAAASSAAWAAARAAAIEGYTAELERRVLEAMALSDEIVRSVAAHTVA